MFEFFVVLLLGILVRLAVSAILMVSYDAVADWQGWASMPFWVAFATLLVLEIVGSSFFKTSVETKQ